MKKLLVLVAVLALIAAMVVPMAAFAADTIVTGNIVAPTISMAAPGAINFGQFTYNVQSLKQTSSYGTVTVVPGSANHVFWTVTASDQSQGGFMYTAGYVYKLINKLYISPDNVSWPTADAGITYNGEDSIGNLDFYAAQTVVPADPEGTYYNTVTFAVVITSSN